jgi:SAM-dependent methyltransferase
MDILKDISDISGKFDVIFAFGLVHHIPSSEFRTKWFQQVVSLLKPNGIFVFTTWNYDRDARFTPVNTEIKNFEEELEDGDYCLGWDNKKDAYRYVHIYTTEEIEKILASSNAKLLSKFSSDGKNGNLNDYYIVGQK